MITLAESDPDAAGVLAKKVLDDPERYAPVVVAEAANIRFGEAQPSRTQSLLRRTET